MCEYAEIEKIKLSNGKTIKEVNEEVRKEVERIYLGKFCFICLNNSSISQRLR